MRSTLRKTRADGIVDFGEGAPVEVFGDDGAGLEFFDILENFIFAVGVIGASGGAIGVVKLEVRAGEARVEDRKSTRLNSSHIQKSRMPSSA